MRRNDREVTKQDELINIISSCQVCRLGMVDDGEPYIVPLNFGYAEADGQLVLYFHSAPAGRKISVLRANPTVCFEMDCGHELVEGGEIACRYGYAYRSITGMGEVSFITDGEEKKFALTRLMKHQTGRDFQFTDEMAESVAVFQVTVTGMTGKCHTN